MGCGTGLTSFALCAETGAKVLANDLWISGEDNAARFAAWGVGDRSTPVQENADNLRFAPESFDAVVSIDSYHYFAGKEGYFQQFVEVTELRCFETAWQDWLATENEYAKADAASWETIIKPYTNFVGMIVRKRSK